MTVNVKVYLRKAHKFDLCDFCNGAADKELVINTQNMSIPLCKKHLNQMRKRLISLVKSE